MGDFGGRRLGACVRGREMLPGVGDACSGGGCPPALQPRARTTLSSVALGGPLQLGRAVPVPIPISCPIPIPTLLPACPTTVGSGEVLEEGSAEALCPLFATKRGTVPKGTVCCQGACAATVCCRPSLLLALGGADPCRLLLNSN